jgi:hypothetical protein
MAHKLAPPHAKLLKEITEASHSQPGYHFAKPELVKHLESLGLVETNPELTDSEGKVAARLVPTKEQPVVQEQPDSSALVAVQPNEGQAESESGSSLTTSTGQPITNERKSKVAFAIETHVSIQDLPKASRDVRYPFSEMPVGSSFFVPATDKSYKSLSSAVATAQRRFSVPNADGATRIDKKGNTVAKTTFTKKFSVRPVEKGHTYANGQVEAEDGSRVFRIA